MNVQRGVWLAAMFLTFPMSSFSASAQKASTTESDRITARVCNYAGINSYTLVRTQGRVSEIFTEAGFKIHWIPCPRWACSNDLQLGSRRIAAFTEEEVDRMHRNWMATRDAEGAAVHAEEAVSMMRGNPDMKGRADGFIHFADQGTKEPRSARDYFERGLARAHAGDTDGAIEDFISAIALNSCTRAPKRVKHPGSNLDEKRQSVLYENLLVIDKDNALAYFNIGTLLIAQGRLSEAIDTFSKAIRIHPRYGPAFNNRGYVKNLMGDVDGASRDFDRSVQLDPRNPIMYFNRGVFRLEIQNFAGAIADFTRAIEIDPGLDRAFHDRGRAYMAQGRLNEAHRDFDMAIELEPDLYAAYGNRGLVRILQGRDSEAEADLARYLQYAGDKKDILEGLVRKARESRHANGVKASGNLPAIAP